METKLKKVIRITELSQQRDSGHRPDGELVFSDWSYSANVEIEISGAGQSITHKVGLPLEEWQYRTIMEARVEARKLFREQVSATMKALGVIINTGHLDKLEGTPCPAIESGGSES